MNDQRRLSLIDPDKFAGRILSLLQTGKPNDFLFADIVTLVQEETAIECIGLRLRDGLDYPYYVARGFSRDFVEKENFLCRRDAEGNPIMGPQGLPRLDCMCGYIIRGSVDPSLPCFTKYGSFWTGSTTDVIARVTSWDMPKVTRNRCNSEGYESVAIIPVRDREVYGLLQLNDRRPNLYALDFIESMEWIAGSIGTLISYLHREKKSHSLVDGLGLYQPYRIFGPIGSGK